MASTRAWTVLTTLCCIALAPVGARASLTTEAGQDEVIATLGSAVTIKAHNANANTQLNQALSDPGFWEGSWAKTYTDKTYDQIKMKPLDSGYFPMIGGEGGQDFDHDVVSHVVFNRQTELPKYMSGAKAVVPLGRGIDSEVGAEFNDVFLVLDLTFFYATYPREYTSPAIG